MERNLRPEQRRALDYFRRAGSEAPVASLRRRLASTFEQVETLLAGVDEAVVRERPGEGKWSLLEVVDHLVESHRPVVADLERQLAGEEVTEAVPAHLLSADPHGHDWRRRLADLAAVHRDLLALLDRVDDETPLAETMPVVMVVQCATADGGVESAEWVERFDWKASALIVRAHTLEHVAQLERILAQVA